MRGSLFPTRAPCQRVSSSVAIKPFEPHRYLHPRRQQAAVSIEQESSNSSPATAGRLPKPGRIRPVHLLACDSGLVHMLRRSARRARGHFVVVVKACPGRVPWPAMRRVCQPAVIGRAKLQREHNTAPRRFCLSHVLQSSVAFIQHSLHAALCSRRHCCPRPTRSTCIAPLGLREPHNNNTTPAQPSAAIAHTLAAIVADAGAACQLLMPH